MVMGHGHSLYNKNHVAIEDKSATTEAHINLTFIVLMVITDVKVIEPFQWRVHIERITRRNTR